jgi:putative SOS response-associated peptidase YedK
MCSNFQAITQKQAAWVTELFQCELPTGDWREEIYPSYLAPFVWLDGDKPKCDLAKFGLIPGWAADRPKFGLKTYNSRSELTHSKPSYRNAWNKRQFGLAIMQSFYEPNYEGSGKAIRWRIRRADRSPLAVASIWERFVDRETGEIVFSFSMLTINADGHEVMQRFHHPDDENRSIVVLQENEYSTWLKATHEQARGMLKLSPVGYLDSESAPKAKT